MLLYIYRQNSRRVPCHHMQINHILFGRQLLFGMVDILNSYHLLRLFHWFHNPVSHNLINHQTPSYMMGTVHISHFSRLYDSLDKLGEYNLDLNCQLFYNLHKPYKSLHRLRILWFDTQHHRIFFCQTMVSSLSRKKDIENFVTQSLWFHIVMEYILEGHQKLSNMDHTLSISHQ